MIYDNYSRPINYLRLAVTDRCNLRCNYCMPYQGVDFLPRKEVLSYEEMERLVNLLASMGISKLRITGGEPFVRKNLIGFLEKISKKLPNLSIHITTNGTLTTQHIPKLKEIGIKSVNLSLDTLDSDKFKKITYSDQFESVMESIIGFLSSNIPLKMNMVVMNGKNTDDILPMLDFAKDYSVSLRFIEEMPFNGTDRKVNTEKWNYYKIIDYIKTHYPRMQQLPTPAHSTSMNFHVPDFKGNIGVIAAYSRTFCHDCNRIRITASGKLKNCLYDNGVLDLKSLMRKGYSDEQLKEQLLKAFSLRAKDGFEVAQSKQHYESMTTIGG